MTAKFDAKRARENMWVTQQNLARQKGGRPHRQFNERKGPPAPAKRAAAEAAPVITSITPVTPVSEPVRALPKSE